jgi:hypothetical protein
VLAARARAERGNDRADSDGAAVSRARVALRARQSTRSEPRERATIPCAIDRHRVPARGEVHPTSATSREVVSRMPSRQPQ